MAVSCETYSTSGRRNRVRQRREELGLTAVQVADHSGVSRITVWRAETGRGEPLASTKRLLAAILQSDVAYLFPEDGR